MDVEPIANSNLLGNSGSGSSDPWSMKNMCRHGEEVQIQKPNQAWVKESIDANLCGFRKPEGN
jgi:hypothetical protein